MGGMMSNSGSKKSREDQIQMPTMGVMMDWRVGSVRVDSVVWNHLSLYVYLRRSEQKKLPR